jgi:anaerobic selenocysteine-containing dehydrogenase
MATNNTMAYPYTVANQMAKRLDPNYKHYVISPEITDTGVINATDWVQIRNQTDPAMIAGMIYHLLDTTFDANTGAIKPGALLDVNYIDTVLYGFFDSPEYWIRIANAVEGSTLGSITTTNPNSADWRKVLAVPAGRSYASWIMGSDDRLTKATYANTGNNYTATQYGNMPRAGRCSYPVGGNAPTETNTANSRYYTKRDYLTPKTPEWAEKITGVPAATIRELAELYARDENKPILTEWAGGLQKSENGVITMFAIQTLFALTKNWGYNIGSTGGMYVSHSANSPNWDGVVAPLPYGPMPSMPGIATVNLRNDGDIGAVTATQIGATNAGVSGNPGANQLPPMSCSEHHTGLYFAFKEVLDQRGFTGRGSPWWDGSTRYIRQDAGVKSQVLYRRAPADGVSWVNRNIGGVDYRDWIGSESGEQVLYSGKRYYIGAAATMFNGVGGVAWAEEIFRLLPLAGVNPRTR